MRLALLALFVALTGCTKAPVCKLDPIAKTASGPPFLWRVHKGGDPLWLYGTIHNIGIDGVPKAALDALEGSVRVVTELGATTPDPDLFREYARLRRGPGIDQRLLTSDWFDLRDVLRDVIEEDDLRRAAPWYAMSLLTTYLAPTPGPSMDALLGRRAQELAMPVEALETWEEQLVMLSSTVNVEDLTEAIRARQTMRCDLEAMQLAYKAGDTERMTGYLVTQRTAETLLYARNRAWLPKLEAYVPKGGAFIAVGLGHMLGTEGLPILFEQAGYTVERVPLR